MAGVLTTLKQRAFQAPKSHTRATAARLNPLLLPWTSWADARQTFDSIAPHAAHEAANLHVQQTDGGASIAIVVF